VCFPPCLVRPGRRLPVQGLSEGSRFHVLEFHVLECSISHPIPRDTTRRPRSTVHPERVCPSGRGHRRVCRPGRRSGSRTASEARRRGAELCACPLRYSLLTEPSPTTAAPTRLSPSQCRCTTRSSRCSSGTPRVYVILQPLYQTLRLRAKEH
jgi:hypothetical protein